MFKQKGWKFFVVLMLVVLVVAGCNAGQPPVTEPADTEPEAMDPEETMEETPMETMMYADGLYYATGKYSEQSGWKSAVLLEVSGGKITQANWTGISNKSGPDKKEASMGGMYPMVENGGAQAPWHEQAKKAEDHLLMTQDPKDIVFSDDEGHTDAISGVSINVNDFFTLAEAALEAGPQQPGPYKDGYYMAEADDFANGWKGQVKVTVLFGRLESIQWTGVNEEGLDKITASMEGKYPMVENGGAQAPWHDQSMKVTDHVTMNQDPMPVAYIDDEGHTDAITGVSVHVNDFYDLLEKALMDAK